MGLDVSVDGSVKSMSAFDQDIFSRIFLRKLSNFQAKLTLVNRKRLLPSGASMNFFCSASRNLRRGIVFSKPRSGTSGACLVHMS